MKYSKYLLAVLFAAVIQLAAYGQPQDKFKISVMGSSVPTGYSADSLRGYVWQYRKLLESRYKDGESPNPWHISNISIPGDCTLDLLGRYQQLLDDNAPYVVYALSLGNEGIHGAADGEKIFARFRDNMTRLIEMARRDGKYPLVTNNYTRADFTEEDYGYIKRMNLLIHQWDVPSVNLLGAIDDGHGRWVKEYEGDPWHPNTAGHVEFCYAIVPSLFDALEASKPLPVKEETPGIKTGRKTLAFTPEGGQVHPFTLSLKVKTRKDGTVSLISHEGNNDPAVLRIEDGSLAYSSGDKSVSGKSRIADGKWHTVTLTHFYARGETLIYADGELQGNVKEKIAATRFSFPGTSDGAKGNGYAELKPIKGKIAQLLFYRSGMNADEVKAMYEGQLLKSSLELYCPLSRGDISNRAQSLNALQD